MVIKYSRAQRRHDRARMYKKVRSKYYWVTELNEKELHIWYSKLRDNVCICSCAMCGNPRRTYGYGSGELTMQEIKALDSYNNDIEELDEF